MSKKTKLLLVFIILMFVFPIAMNLFRHNTDIMVDINPTAIYIVSSIQGTLIAILYFLHNKHKN